MTSFVAGLFAGDICKIPPTSRQKMTSDKGRHEVLANGEYLGKKLLYMDDVAAGYPHLPFEIVFQVFFCLKTNLLFVNKGDSFTFGPWDSSS